MESKVLQLVKLEKLPPPEIACRECQFATWMEFNAGPKCYCAVTQAWMYEPHSQEANWVLNCDKQMQEMQEQEDESAQGVTKLPESKTMYTFHEKSDGVDAPMMPGDTRTRCRVTGQGGILRADGSTQWEKALPIAHPGTTFIYKKKDGTEEKRVFVKQKWDKTTTEYGVLAASELVKNATADDFLKG